MINIIFGLETFINIIYMPYKPHKTSLEQISKNHVFLTVRHSTIPLKGQLQCSLVRATYFERFAQIAPRPLQIIVQWINASNKSLKYFCDVFGTIIG